MMRAVRSTACLALVLAAACGPKPRPTTMRDLEGNDVGNCFGHASIGVPNLHGEGTLMLYVDTDGAVAASWWHDAGALDSPQFFRCMTSLSVENKVDASPTDRVAGWQVACEADHGCAIHPLNMLPPAPFDEKLAQASLTFADWADSTDKGWGYYYAHSYSDALATFQSVVEVSPNDARAQRGLAQSLLETGGDLKKAREAAEKAVSLKKNAASLEALVRVCLKQGDDDCTVKNFVDATHDADVTARRFDLGQLNDAAKAANDRLQAADKAREEAEAKARAEAEAAAAAKADPLGCGKMSGMDQAKCYVKGCFGEGAAAYAKELSKASGAAYEVLEMTAAAGAGTATLVTIPVRKANEKKKRKPDTTQDATWTVDNGGMKAGSFSAAAIAKDHNACNK
jgi:tetratricopeptide (TPR) repeat protein